jgi:pterin-4a-carbinolamine dehydratase
MNKLNEEQITAALKLLSNWNLADGSIRKTFTTAGFPQTMGLATAICAICQSRDHHPDYLTLKYSSVEVSFSTHSVKGITEKDTGIAAEIDKLNY